MSDRETVVGDSIGPKNGSGTSSADRVKESLREPGFWIGAPRQERCGGMPTQGGCQAKTVGKRGTDDEG
jgi:hypothetical protein